MKKRMWKIFPVSKYREEEKWINKMEQEGWHLVNVGFLHYDFVRGEPNTYQYAMELMTGDREEREKYFSFLKEYGVECADTFTEWAYLRREKQDEDFILFSDNESMIQYKKRVFRNLMSVLLLLLFNVVFMIFNFIDLYKGEETLTGFFIFRMVLHGLSALAIFAVAPEIWRLHKEMKEMKA